MTMWATGQWNRPLRTTRPAQRSNRVVMNGIAGRSLFFLARQKYEEEEEGKDEHESRRRLSTFWIAHSVPNANGITGIAVPFSFFRFDIFSSI